MTSQVLARKWRPRRFDELVGQDHVVRALARALDDGRLHHAYLFTGTRGVGKTTVSRILAKALNCETGVSSTPCGQCSACTQIDSGRFADYLELDAASNRGVEEISQVLDQSVYAPTVGRFKVYMIDEVHMLSTHAFNALLKTLEEPPEHLKFVIATTDPQKVPVTILSRCLQFGLRQISVAQIAEQLSKVLTAESIGFEPQALKLIAKSARGSMRDALSITDQAIAYCGRQIEAAPVEAMLGTVDRHLLLDILSALAAHDGRELLAHAARMGQLGLSFSQSLDDLAALLQRLAVLQVAPDAADALDEQDPDTPALTALAQRFSSEHVQVCFSIALHGRAELALCVDEATGFCMTLLRMLAFRPAQERPDSPRAGSTPPSSAPGTPSGTASSAPSGTAPGTAPIASSAATSAATPTTAKAATTTPTHAAPLAGVTVTTAAPGARLSEVAATPSAPRTAPPSASLSGSVSAEPPASATTLPNTAAHVVSDRADDTVSAPPPTPASTAPLLDTEPAVLPTHTDAWVQLAPRLALQAMARTAALNSQWLGLEQGVLRLAVKTQELASASVRERLQQALTAMLGQPLTVELVVAAVEDSHHLRLLRQRAAAVAALEQELRDHPFTGKLIAQHGGVLVKHSLRLNDA